MQSCSAFLVFGLLTIGTLNGQTLFPTEPKVRLAGVFNLASKLSAAGTDGGVVVMGMQAKEGKLFFLVTTHGGARESVLVRTSLTEDIKYAVRIGAADDIVDWAITDCGEGVVETQVEGNPLNCVVTAQTGNTSERLPLLEVFSGRRERAWRHSSQPAPARSLGPRIRSAGLWPRSN
jgi:hypothetical protein